MTTLIWLTWLPMADLALPFGLWLRLAGPSQPFMQRVAEALRRYSNSVGGAFGPYQAYVSGRHA